METNRIILAPATSSPLALFSLWQENHVGTIDEFYAFLVTPSTGRTAFMASLSLSHTHVSAFTTYDINPKPSTLL